VCGVLLVTALTSEARRNFREEICHCLLVRTALMQHYGKELEKDREVFARSSRMVSYVKNVCTLAHISYGEIKMLMCF